MLCLPPPKKENSCKSRYSHKKSNLLKLLHTVQGLCHMWYLQKAECNKSAFHKLLDAMQRSEVKISSYAHEKEACINHVMLLNFAFILWCICTWWRSLQLRLGTSCTLLPSDTCSAQKPLFWGTFALTKSKAVVFQETKHGLQDLNSWTLDKWPWAYHFAALSAYMKWGCLCSWVVSLYFHYSIVCVKIIFYLIDE